VSELNTTGLARLGMPALPLAFVALPLYMFWPHHMATQFGVSLGVLGGLLFLARAFDALTDPAIGWWVDRLFARSALTVWRRSLAVATALSVCFVLLFFPQWLLGHTMTMEALLLLCTVLLVVGYAAYSFLSIALQTWGARLGGDRLARSRLVAWREGLALAGVILASVVPSWLGLHVLVSGFVLLMGLSLWAWWSAPRPVPVTLPHLTEMGFWRSLARPWQHAGFRRLLLVFMLNGIASAVPATLILFFVQDRLQLPAASQMQFLGAYFVAAAVSFPLWLRVIRMMGLRRAWLLGMGLATAVFIWTLSLGAGDAVAFTWVCVLSGLALGADLVAPGALLNGLLSEADPAQPAHAGAYLGWWQVATKLNLALAAGLALPLLNLLGYTPGTQDAPALLALSWAYALVPCLLKLLAAAVLFASASVLHKE
jgi:Na+/melibiose symporter-like transporter